MDKGIVYVLIGDRDEGLLEHSISSVRKYTDLPIIIWADNIKYRPPNTSNLMVRYFNSKKYDHKRNNNRNSSLYRLIALKESPFDNTLYLDNDIAVVDRTFFDGFNVASNFGLTMVENPRQFIKSPFNIGDINQGEDVTEYDKNFLQDMPNCMMALNMGVMFYNKSSESFLDELIWEQENNPSRGQAGLYRTIWKTKQFPYALPFQWLVCKKHIGINNPLALHLGHPNIKQWYFDNFHNR